MELSPFSCYFLPFRSEYYTQRSGLKLFLVCGISVNYNFLFSIIDVCLNVTMLHVSVVLTNIRRFINNTMCQCSLLNILRNGSVCYWP